MSKLPYCVVRYPTCGACERETEFDGGTYYCPSCLLSYGDGDGIYRAEFLEDVSACGFPACACNSCRLPKGHTSAHWCGCLKGRASERAPVNIPATIRT